MKKNIKIGFVAPLLTVLTLGGCSNVTGKLGMQSSDSEEEEIEAILTKLNISRSRQDKTSAPRLSRIVSITDIQNALKIGDELIKEVEEAQKERVQERKRWRLEIKKFARELDNVNLTDKERKDLSGAIYEISHNITHSRNQQTTNEKSIQNYNELLPCVWQQLTNGESIDAILAGNAPFGEIFEIVYCLTKDLIREKETTIGEIKRFKNGLRENEEFLRDLQTRKVTKEIEKAQEQDMVEIEEKEEYLYATGETVTLSAMITRLQEKIATKLQEEVKLEAKIEEVSPTLTRLWEALNRFLLLIGREWLVNK